MDITLVSNQDSKLTDWVTISQYHGGTNFGHTSGGPFITTSYDYDAPLDEYGMLSIIYLLSVQYYVDYIEDFSVIVML